MHAHAAAPRAKTSRRNRSWPSGSFGRCSWGNGASGRAIWPCSPPLPSSGTLSSGARRSCRRCRAATRSPFCAPSERTLPRSTDEPRRFAVSSRGIGRLGVCCARRQRRRGGVGAFRPDAPRAARISSRHPSPPPTRSREQGSLVPRPMPLPAPLFAVRRESCFPTVPSVRVPSLACALPRPPPLLLPTTAQTLTAGPDVGDTHSGLALVPRWESGGQTSAERPVLPRSPRRYSQPRRGGQSRLAPRPVVRIR